MDKIIQVGTVISIDDDFIEAFDKAVDEGIITLRENEEWCSEVYSDWLPRNIEFKETRIDRGSVHLTWNFLGGELADVDHFDLTVFKKMGYKIIQPKQVKISIMEADDDILDAGELVRKYLIKQEAKKGKVRTYAEGLYTTVVEAMNECGVVFYKP